MKVQVTINNVKIIKETGLNENEYNIHEFEFEFVEEYKGLTKKAVFTDANEQSYIETIVNNKCSVPTEVLHKNEYVTIGVYAYVVEDEELKLRYSPQPTHFFVNEGSYKTVNNSTPPTPSEIEQLQSQITHNANDIEDLQQNVSENTTAIENLQNDVGDIQTEQTEQNTKIQKNTDDIVDINQSIGAINTEIGEINQDINNLENNKADKSQLSVYSLITETGSQIELNINTTNYKMKSILKDKNGNTIFTSNEIDLPLESFVVSATYDNTTKEIVLTLQNGQTIRFSVADLVSGLVSVDDLQTILANYYTETQIDNLLNNKVDKVQGKGLSTEDFTTAEKTKLAGIEAEANKTIVDNELNNTSENPVQNKVIYEALSEKQTEINNLQTDVEDLRNASLKVIGTGTDITLNNTSKGRLLKNEPSGRTEQTQLTGKNLLTFPYTTSSELIDNKGKLIIGTLSNAISITFATTLILPAGTYILSGNSSGENFPNVSYMLLKNEDNNTFINNYIRKNYSFSLETQTTISCGIVLPSGTYNTDIEPMIRLSSITDNSWEPYCGGIPAPNLRLRMPY